MKKYSLFFGIWLIGFALAPLIAILTMTIFLSYRFIFRHFWRNDELLIKISVIIGLVGLFLGFFATGVPHIIQMFLKVIRLVVEFNLDSDSSSLLFSFWFFCTIFRTTLTTFFDSSSIHSTTYYMISNTD